MKSKKPLVIVFLVLVAFLLIIALPGFIDILYTPKQKINDGDVWIYDDFAISLDEGNAYSDPIMASFIGQEHYILYTPSGKWYDYTALRDYLTCEDGVIKRHHHVGKESTGSSTSSGSSSGTIIMGEIYKSYEIVIEEIGTYNKKKLEFNSGNHYTDGYASENIMYINYNDGIGEVQLRFELKE